MSPLERRGELQPRLHLLRGFVGWTNRHDGTPITTVTEAEDWVNYVASCGFDRFYTWTMRRPRRAEELESGSVFFVGGERRAQALFRMPLVEIEASDGGFAICMRPELIRVERRFVGRVRGWRYLDDANAPSDLPEREQADDLPADLARVLDELGVG